MTGTAWADDPPRKRPQLISTGTDPFQQGRLFARPFFPQRTLQPTPQ
jgi:hypothetical protein